MNEPVPKHICPLFYQAVLQTSHRLAVVRARQQAIELMDDVSSQCPNPLTDGPGMALICEQQARIVRGWFSEFRQTLRLK